MKILIGTDIVEVERIKQNIMKHENRFLDKIFTKGEIDYCESKNIQKFQSYAVRFAAKEAIYKALSIYIVGEYSWKDFEILKAENGRPKVKIHLKIEDLEDIDVSLSHCKEYAVAYVMAKFKE